MVSVLNNYFIRTTAVTAFALLAVLISVLTAGEASALPDREGQSPETLSIASGENGGQERLIRSPALGGNFFRLNTARGFGKRSSPSTSMPMAARIAAAVMERQRNNNNFFGTPSMNFDAPTSSDSQLFSYPSADASDAYESSSSSSIDSMLHSRPFLYAGNRNPAAPPLSRSMLSSHIASLPLGSSSMAYIPYETSPPMRSLRGFRYSWRNSE